MAGYQGDIRLGDTIDVKFCTVQASGAPTTLAGSPVISAYLSNSTTQLTAGITLSVDFDAVTGLNNVRVVATSGNGYATATNYSLIITTGTVNSVSAVGYEVGSFSIENRSAVMPATAGRTLVVDAAGLADANAVKLGPTGSGTAQTARDIGASVLLSSGTGTGQLDFTAGVVKVNATQILGGAIPAVTTTGVPKVDVQNWTGTAVAAPATAGVVEANVKNINNVSASAVTTVKAVQGLTTADTITTTTTATNLTNAPTAGDFTAAMKTSLNAATPASVTGAVGSVTGAVGSVTGNVGGNVVGSVASVIGNVSGSVASVVAVMLTGAVNCT